MKEPLTATSKNDPFKGAASFSLKHRLLRMLWSIVWVFFASWTPAPFHRWRVFLVNLFGANVHKTAVIHNSTRIWYPPNLVMHEYACLGPRVNCYNMTLVTIGYKAIVSQDSTLCAGTHDINDPHFQLITKPITIGVGAWVAANAFIGPGVTVADSSVIVACGVVFKSTEKNGVYGGNPAKLIKLREIHE